MVTDFNTPLTQKKREFSHAEVMRATAIISIIALVLLTIAAIGIVSLGVFMFHELGENIIKNYHYNEIGSLSEVFFSETFMQTYFLGAVGGTALTFGAVIILRFIEEFRTLRPALQAICGFAASWFVGGYSFPLLFL